MPRRLTDNAFVSPQSASNSIPPTTDMHPTVLLPCEGISSYTQDSQAPKNNNNVGVQVGDHVVAKNPSPPSHVVAPPHRDYNTNNWSVHEMLVLQAAKLEFESNLRARNPHHHHHHNNNNNNNKMVVRERDNVVRISSKERWSWIENACWNVGVFRSQKQCHDKWEGVTTQFRKVARFNEKLKIASSNNNNKSSSGVVVEDYWSMSQLARKQNKLPANFSREVFNALRENHFGGGGGGGGGGGNNCTTTSSDYSALQLLGFTSNNNHHHHAGGGGEDDAAQPPNRKRKLETTSDEEGGLEGVAAAILSAVERADERHKELMEFERTKFEFEKEKLHGFANLGNGVMRLLISINEAMKERLDGGDHVTTAHGKSSS